MQTESGFQRRRAFLKQGVSYGVLCFAAFNFGCSVKKEVGTKSGQQGPKIAIVYASRYGATAQTAEWIAKGMGEYAEVVNIDALDTEKALEHYDGFIVGSGVWNDRIDPKIEAFLTRNSEALQKRLPATFIVCGSRGETEACQARIAEYLDQLNAPLLQPPVFQGHFGGRIQVDALSAEDREAVKQFYADRLGIALQDRDLRDPNAAYRFGKKADARIKEGCANA